MVAVWTESRKSIMRGTVMIASGTEPVPGEVYVLTVGDPLDTWVRGSG